MMSGQDIFIIVALSMSWVKRRRRAKVKDMIRAKMRMSNQDGVPH